MRTILAGVLAISSGCGSACRRSEVAHASRDLALALSQNKQPEPERPPTTSLASLETRLYLDATESMAGFVGGANRSTFDQLLDEIGTALPRCQLFRYGQEVDVSSTEPSPIFARTGFGAQVHDPTFYSADFNPDDRLVEYLASEAPSIFSVIVTDGVYSEPAGSTSPPVVEAYRKCMQRGMSLGVFVLRSEFVGNFYSESRRAWLGQLSVPSRPFYAFVLSPAAKAIEDFAERIRTPFPEAELLLFASAGARATMSLKSGPTAYSSSRSGEPLWGMFEARAFTDAGVFPLEYTIDLDIPSNYPAAEMRIETAADYYTWRDGRFVKSETGPPEGFRAETEKFDPATSGAEGTRLRISIPFDRSVDYGFYHLRITPMFKSVRGSIADLSTRDDGNPQDANRTFRFYELITALTDVHFAAHIAPRTSSSAFVTVGSH
jgi:hypothetical protein